MVLWTLVGLSFVITPFGALALYLVRVWMQGPTKGSDNPKKLDGKTVVITGANTGIGKVTATDLAKRGAKVIICCRDETRANKAVEEIKKESSNENVQNVILDLASLASVRKCASIIKRTEPKIDYLINNAGVMMCPQWKTQEGFDMQMGTNHFGHFLFTELLLPLLENSKKTGHTPRIVIVSSLAHTGAKNGINFDDINFEKKFSTMEAYCQSKLANVLHAKGLAKRLNGISVYSLHPGVIATELTRHVATWMGPFKGVYNWLVEFISKDPFHGAQTTLYCTLEDSIENQSGLYYSDCNVKDASSQGKDSIAIDRLWELSEKMVGLKSRF